MACFVSIFRKKIRRIIYPLLSSSTIRKRFDENKLFAGPKMARLPAHSAKKIAYTPFRAAPNPRFRARSAVDSVENAHDWKFFHAP
jgi:hypothetical protein